MSYSIEIKEEARQDIFQATSWYATRSTNLHFRLIKQIEVTLKSILNDPGTYKKIYKNFRQASLKKFPYVIINEFNKHCNYIQCLSHR